MVAKKKAKKVTESQKIKKMLDEALKNAPGIAMSGCNFQGSRVEVSASVDLIAQGLLVNAEALKNLSEMVRSSNIRIDSLVTFEEDQIKLGVSDNE